MKIDPEELFTKFGTEPVDESVIAGIMERMVKTEGYEIPLVPDMFYGIPESFFNEKIKKARDYAEIVHGDQKYGDQPYIKHLADAYKVFLEFIIEPVYGKVTQDGFVRDSHGYVNIIEKYQDIACALLLHDTIEDTTTTRDELAEIFGDDVADLVDAVSGVGKNRAERLKSIIRKVEERPDAIVVKLCDRIANTRASEAEFRAGQSKLFMMYVGELPAFKAALGGVYSEVGFIKRMWEYLESISKE